jgi:hypothetical protein
MSATGKITRVWSKPTRGFELVVPPQPGPPPEPETAYLFIGVDADDWALVCMAFALKSDATVSGTAPACTGVTLP